MKNYTIEHKHCGTITTIEGNDVYDAFRRNNKYMNLWKVIRIEEN